MWFTLTVDPIYISLQVKVRVKVQGQGKKLFFSTDSEIETGKTSSGNVQKSVPKLETANNN